MRIRRRVRRLRSAEETLDWARRIWRLRLTALGAQYWRLANENKL